MTCGGCRLPTAGLRTGTDDRLCRRRRHCMLPLWQPLSSPLILHTPRPRSRPPSLPLSRTPPRPLSLLLPLPQSRVPPLPLLRSLSPRSHCLRRGDFGCRWHGQHRSCHRCRHCGILSLPPSLHVSRLPPLPRPLSQQLLLSQLLLLLLSRMQPLFFLLPLLLRLPLRPPQRRTLSLPPRLARWPLQWPPAVAVVAAAADPATANGCVTAASAVFIAPTVCVGGLARGRHRGLCRSLCRYRDRCRCSVLAVTTISDVAAAVTAVAATAAAPVAVAAVLSRPSLEARPLSPPRPLARRPLQWAAFVTIAAAASAAATAAASVAATDVATLAVAAAAAAFAAAAAAASVAAADAVGLVW